MRVKYKDNAQGLIEMGINTLEAEREHNNLNAFKFGNIDSWKNSIRSGQ